MAFHSTSLWRFFGTKLHGSLLASPAGRGRPAEGHESSLGARLPAIWCVSAIGQSATSLGASTTQLRPAHWQCCGLRRGPYQEWIGAACGRCQPQRRVLHGVRMRQARGEHSNACRGGGCRCGCGSCTAAACGRGSSVAQHCTDAVRLLAHTPRMSSAVARDERTHHDGRSPSGRTLVEGWGPRCSAGSGSASNKGRRPMLGSELNFESSSMPSSSAKSRAR